MKHKFAFKVTLWWVLGLMLLGGSLMAFGRKDSRESTLENRMLQGFPRLTYRSVFSGKFMQEFESYLADSFFARGDVVSASEDLLGVFSAQTTEELLTRDIGADIQGEIEAREAPAEESAVQPPEEIAPPETQVQDRALPPGITAGDSLNQRDPDYRALYEYNFWLIETDGDKRHVYTYTAQSIEALMQGLNGIRSVLPEDGTVHFALVPVAQTANWWTRNPDTFQGWLSNAEEYMTALASDGVYIYNAPEVLAPGLSAGEYLYYRTDHHWTPRGAYKVFAAMMERQGLPVTDFDDYRYTVNAGYLGSIYSENPTAALRAMADDIEIPSSLGPVHSYLLRNLTQQKEIEYMAYDYANYLAFLRGTQTPWRRIVSGFHTGRNCLVVTDSFGNCFAPYLLPYYDEVHMVDLRKGYFSEEDAGASVGEYMQKYGIDDVYVVLCTASGLQYNYTQIYLSQYIR